MSRKSKFNLSVAAYAVNTVFGTSSIIAMANNVMWLSIALNILMGVTQSIVMYYQIIENKNGNITGKTKE